MPIQECTSAGKSGFKYGQSGTCYTHDGSGAGKAAAKKKAVAQAIAINGGTAPRNLEVDEALIAQVKRELADELQTVDLDNVEILRAGGPVHAIGSPPEGDHFTADDIRGMAAAAQELEAAGELRAPAKIGHDPRQRLASGVTPGEMPAVGWLTNQRASEDGTRLFADIKKVPARVAKLIEAGAYRTRSSELFSLTSQKTGKKYPWVVSGMAWLGGKMPSVRTLDDVVRLYEGDEGERRIVLCEEVETASVDDLRDAVAAVGVDYAKAQPGSKRSASDTRSNMPELTLNEEQTGALAETLGLEGEFDADKLIEAAKAKAEKPEQRTLEQEEVTRRLEQAEKTADEAKAEAKRANDALASERKLSFVEGILKDGKAEPGQRAEIETLYDKDPEAAQKFFESVKPNGDLVKEYGSDDEGTEEEQAKKRELEENDYTGYAGVHLGIDKDEVI